MRGPVLAIAVLVGSLAGCVPTVDVHVPEAECADVPGSVCNQQIQAAANAVGGNVRKVVIVCTAPACTRAGGSGTATVTRADGSQVVRAWAYVGDPGPVPVPVCVGIAADVCRQRVDEAIDEVTIRKRLVGINVRCDDRCDENSGTIRIEYVFGDGSKETTTTAWE